MKQIKLHNTNNYDHGQLINVIFLLRIYRLNILELKTTAQTT